jgi:hypothetical protein
MAEVQHVDADKVEGTVEQMPPTAEQLMRAQPINPYEPLVFTKLSNKDPFWPKNIHRKE